MLAQDSPSYIEMSSFRTLGYPLFLASLRAAGLPIESVPSVQLVAFCLALAFLGWATARTTPRTGWAALLVVGIAANPFLAEYHFLIVTESLFLTLQMVIAGLLILYLHHPTRSSLALAGLAIGLVVTVRPVGYAFVPLLPLAALLAPHARLRVRAVELGIALAAALAIIAIESAAYHARFGSERHSLAPLHLFAKAGLIDGAAANPYPPSDARHGIWQALRPELEEVRTMATQGTRTYLDLCDPVWLESFPHPHANGSIDDALRLLHQLVRPDAQRFDLAGLHDLVAIGDQVEGA